MSKVLFAHAQVDKSVKLYRAKVGTIPALVRLRYAYKPRPGLSVVYRVIGFTPFGLEDNGPWERGVVDSYSEYGPNPTLFLSRM